MGKKIYRPKKSVKPLKPSPRAKVSFLVGSALNGPKEKLIREEFSDVRLKEGETIEELLQRIAADDSIEDSFKAAKLRRLGKKIHAMNKEKIISEIAPYLEPEEGESQDDFIARLAGKNGPGISNTKILKLKRVADRMRDDFDGKRENLENAILEMRKGSSGKIDEGYRRHLHKKSLATLLLQHDHMKKQL